MSKTSRKNRERRSREALERRQAQQNRIISIIAALAVTAIVIVFVWQYAGNDDETPTDTADAFGAGAGAAIADGDTGAAACFSDDAGGTRPLAALAPAARNGYYDAFPATVIDPEIDYEAIISVQGRGDMRVKLFAAEAPETVNNFVFLAQQGYYDCVPFHRVLDNFMAQTGDPSGTGGGGPGYQFADETDNGLAFDRSGLLAMANAGPGTNGSQFFITFAPTPWLDGNHTIFGELLEGADVLNSITKVDPQQPGGAVPDVIQRIQIIES